MDVDSQPSLKEGEETLTTNAVHDRSPPTAVNIPATDAQEKKTAATEKPNNTSVNTSPTASDQQKATKVADKSVPDNDEDTKMLVDTTDHVGCKEVKVVNAARCTTATGEIEKMDTEDIDESDKSQKSEEQAIKSPVEKHEECEDSQKEETSTVGDASQSPSTEFPTPLQSVAVEAAAHVASASPTAAAVVANIPDNILSPPKSETQTDDATTATSSSTSPASDSQLSPLAASGTATIAATATTLTTTDAPAPSPPTKTTSESSSTPPATAGGTRVVQPINVVANGTIPKSSGKPHMAAMNKKLNKTSRTTRPRKQKATVPMYESEISDNKTGIKLCIKKSDSSGNLAAAGATTPPATVTSNKTVNAASVTKQTRKRSRKSKTRPRVDSDDSEYETKRKKERTSNNNAERQKKVSFSGTTNEEQHKQRQCVEQSDWGAKLPKEILCQIFQLVVEKEGCLPTLFRLGRVCSLWRSASLSPTLWKTMDLSTWIKEKYRTELKLKWFVDNRCSACTELNVANWKVSDINCFLTKLANGCPNLTGITLSGWKGFTSDHLSYLVDNIKKLERLDLSSINVEMNASKSAVGLQSLCNALQTMNGRLTHLYLAHNRLAGIPQIVTILATHCPNLLLLDLSNVTTQATSHGILHIEKLQHGCSKLKVLRVTNSHVTLGPATMQEMMDSPGFPDLEELSVAAVTDESRIIGDEHLQRILKTSSKLKLLDVRGCTRLTHESLIRLPAWDIKHLFLSGCSVTRDMGSGLELIASKWAHSLIELDLAWANVQQPLDNALRALAEKGAESPLAHLNLCGSSVSDEAVKEILANCAHMSSINLSSCRGLPRGVKRLVQGPQELQELRDVLKVQMKVKLPSQLKQEREAVEAATTNITASEGGGGGGGDGDGDGGGNGSGSSQSN